MHHMLPSVKATSMCTIAKKFSKTVYMERLTDASVELEFKTIMSKLKNGNNLLYL